MSGENLQAVIAWNVDCAKLRDRQFDHLAKLVRTAEKRGATAVLACLSEVTSPENINAGDGSTLAEKLDREGFNINFQPTCPYREFGQFEGMGFASRDPKLAVPIEKAIFLDTYRHRANWHKVSHLSKKERYLQRRIGMVCMDDIAVYTTHASFHAPPKVEREAILDLAGPVDNGARKVLVGDFNTGIRKQFLTDAQERGWVWLRDPLQTKTWRWRGISAMLDHAFVSPALADSAWLEIGNPGDSDHNPLFVFIKSQETEDSPALPTHELALV